MKYHYPDDWDVLPRLDGRQYRARQGFAGSVGHWRDSMVMVCAGGHISSGHFNPAVIVAVLVRRRITLVDAVAYGVVQVVGAAQLSTGEAHALDSAAARN